ncbi:MAG: signal peptide peptidase SppA [Paludibacteraceae bacterium]|nr:signal peptide peptidase SppA [Paludibacteraceae bacterium]
MSFVKSFFACLTAIIVSGLLFMLLLLIYVAIATKPADIEQNSILSISLDGEIVDREEKDIISDVFSKNRLTNSLEEILASINSAKNDDRIKGIYLKCGIARCGYATLEEIRHALEDFRSTGKFVVSYSGSYTQGNYYVASVADSLFVNPQGALDLRGIAASSIFYKPLLDTLGVEMQVIKVGTYKSFTEQYTNDSMSAPNREQTEQLVQSLWLSVVEKIAESRNIPVSSLNQMANQMMAFHLPSVALKNGLVDGLRYFDEVETSLKTMLSLAADDELHFVSSRDYYAEVSEINQVLSSDDKVAVLFAEGEIDNGNRDGISSSELISHIMKLKDDENIKSVVLRVNSPGGSAYGAEQIWHAVELLKKEKPVIISMGNYAASGGYYLSTGANYIFADRMTITGSIGVFGVIPNVEKLMNKIGIRHEVVKTHPYADVLSNFLRPLDEEEKTILQEHVAEVYDVFLTRCSDGRGKTKEEIAEIAEGRVWSGEKALEIGLVDALGGLNDAIAYAAKNANLTDYAVEYYPKDDVMGKLTELPHIGYDKLFKGNDVFAKEKEMLYRLQSLDFDQAMMPYSVDIK